MECVGWNAAGPGQAGVSFLFSPDGLCDRRDCGFHSVEFLGSQAHLRTKSNASAERYPHATTRCAGGAAGCDPTTVTGSESPAPAAASKGFPLPPGRCPRPLMALGASAVPWLSVPLPARMLTACRVVPMLPWTRQVVGTRQHPVSAKPRLHEG
jgi:hypothetical protein